MKRILVIFLATLLFSIPGYGVGSLRHGHRYRAHKMYVVRKPKLRMNAVFAIYPDLRAAKDVSLEWQNWIADLSGSHRAMNEADQNQMLADGELIFAPKHMDCVMVDPRLKKPLVTLAPDAVDYIKNTLAPAFCASGGGDGKQSPFLVISSLMRTVAYQHVLAERNRNAKAALGDDNPQRRSVHSTGFSLDLSARNLSHEQQLWLGGFLLNEKNAGRLVEAIYEPGQDHFHIMVWPPSFWTSLVAKL